MQALVDKAIWFIDLLTNTTPTGAAAYLALGLVLAILAWAWRRRRVLRLLGTFDRALANKKIALFAKEQNIGKLINVLSRRGPIPKANLDPVSDDDDVGYATDASIFVVYWDDNGDRLEKVIQLKERDKRNVLIVYAPPDVDDIDPEPRKRINQTPNTIITRFRGRLLNDVIIALMTSESS